MRRALMVLVVSLLMASCSGDVERVDSDDNGSQVELATSGRLEVSLEANPTTGYGWHVLETGPLVLIEERHDPESDLVGAGGITTLVFEGEAAGSGALELGYLRPWEEGVAPIDEYRIEVVVRD